MTRTRPVQNTFSAGEIDPLLQSRNDFQRFQTGLEVCRGFVPMRQGGVTRAPGTVHRGTTRGNAKARRIPFQFSVNDSLSLEFSHLKMRVWRYGVLIEADGGGIYELDTPYTEADLPNLDYVQDSDVIYLVDGRQPMQKLSRFALNTWTIAPLALDRGPFRVQNLDESLTIQAAISSSFTSVTGWTAHETLVVGAQRVSGGRVYQVVSGSTTPFASISAGPTAPTHPVGSQTLSWDEFTGGESGTTETRTITWSYVADQFAQAEGTATLTATGAVFRPEHVGTLFRLEASDFTDVPIWAGNVTASIGDLFRFDGNIYELTAGDNTGVNAPIHTSGSVRTDASKATEFTFVSDQSGIVRITAVNDPNEAVADILKPIPQPVIDDPTYRWSEGAWSTLHGHPASIEIFEQRLFAANTVTEPRTIWASTQGLLTDFEPSDEADGSFGFTIAGNGSKNQIEWLQSGRRGIYIGALGEVWRGFSSQSGEAIGPATFDIELVANDGVSPAQPILPYGWPVYITGDKGRAQEIRFSFEEDGSKPVELSLPSQHLGAPGFEQIVWQSAPFRMAWLRRGDGSLAAMVYDPDQDVLGWAPVPVAGGFVEGLDITKSPTGAYDVLTMIVRRTIDGATVRHVEEQSLNFPALQGAEPITHFNHAWDAVIFEPDPAADAFSVPHLAGQDVWAWTDRGQFGPLTVAGDGAVTLPEPVSRATIGLRDATHLFRTLDITAAGREGDTRGIKRRLHAATGLQVFRTVAGGVSSVERHFGQADITNPPQQIVRRQVARDILEPNTGTLRITAPSGHADSVHLEIIPEGIAPLTVTALIPAIEEVGA